VLEASWQTTVTELGGPNLVRGIFTTLGKTQSNRGQSETGSHVTTIEVNLVPSELRKLSSATLSDLWMKNTPSLPGVEALTFNASTGPGAGAAVDVQLTHRDTAILAKASDEIAVALRTYSQLKNVENSFSAGKPQLDFHLGPLARPLGLTSDRVARQLRSAFFGSEALREQRGRNEFKVMVRLPLHQRRSEYDLEQLPIRTPNGGWVPLSSIAQFNRGRAPTTIRREEGKRIVNVKAELAAGTRSPREVLAALKRDIFPPLQQKYPGLSLEFTGSERDQSESLSSLGPNYLLALMLIFTLLAIPFSSYLQPLIIMAAIPFGIVGAVAGHIIMGYSLSIISMFGVIALSGVVVNDSLVLIDSTNKARKKGMSVIDAIVWGGMRRLRPILLTSLTTFFGLAPMILETSVQARFLIPMAISLGFGVLFATFIVLLIIPSLYVIVEDLRISLNREDTSPVEQPHSAPQ
jgi:multidrug efflux pump subunit AcrB